MHFLHEVPENGIIVHRKLAQNKERRNALRKNTYMWPRGEMNG